MEGRLILFLWLSVYFMVFLSSLFSADLLCPDMVLWSWNAPALVLLGLDFLVIITVSLGGHKPLFGWDGRFICGTSVLVREVRMVSEFTILREC